MEDKSISIDALISTMSVFKKLYDVVRVVNPMKKQILDLKLNKVEDLESSCYNLWKKGKVCSNCVSARAYNERETFVKIEYNGEKVYMLTAIPVELDGVPVVLELLKDVTNSGVIENIENKDSGTIHDAVNHMNELVILDPLTKVFNKRFIDERLPADIISSSLNGEPLSLIMADIDFFKKVNDTYGHIAGDEVIKMVADTLKRLIRKDVDWVARYGGEEFIVCLKNTSENSAVKAAERMRKAIENTIISYEGMNIKVTASFGVKTLFEEQLSEEELIKEVDNKLYEAKNTGRNKVTA
ncbi:GGDEF domain-containing protein [Clostridium thailandense]|uniref:GGDEF domain-containing protein n=1 Tax=Clostridium thailandense TaxID=2794346 RepID=UPI003989FCEE